MKILRSLLFPALLTAAPLAAATDDQLVCRVRDTAGGPRLFVNGRAVPPRMFYGDDGMGPVALSEEWTRHSFSFRPDKDVDKGTFHFRFPHETGTVEVRNVTVTSGTRIWNPTLEHYPSKAPCGLIEKTTGPDGTPGFKGTFTLLPDPKDELDVHVYTKPVPLSAAVDHRISFEVRATGGTKMMRVMAYERTYRHFNMPASDGGSLAATTRKAAAAGVDFVTFHVRNLWSEDGHAIDFRPLDRTCRDLIAANPNVKLIPRIRIEATADWFAMHPDLQETFEDGKTRPLSGCIADADYRERMRRHAVAVCKHMMETYPRHFAGIHLCALSHGGEWFFHCTWARLCGDNPPTLKAFRRYLAARGFPDAATATIPSTAERKNRKGVLGSRLLDPAKDRMLFAFNRFRQELVADTIAEMAAACRQATDGKKLVVAFYGYTFEFGQNLSGPANTGNYALARLLENARGNLDILCGPSSYHDRYWAQGGAPMSAAETVLRNGVLWLNEDDYSTYTDFTHRNRSEGCKMTHEQNVNLLRRVDTREAICGYGSWWMDLFGAGWYDNDLWDVRRDLTPFAETLCRNGKPFTPEVAAIVDEDSMLTGIWDSRDVFYPLVNNSRAGFGRMGAPYGQYLFSDIVRRPINAKLKVFLALTYLPPARRQALRALLADDQSVRVWCWAPGWLTDDGADAANIERTTDFRVRLLASDDNRALATATGCAHGLPEEFRGNRARPLFAVETQPGDEVWAVYPDGSPAVVMRRQTKGADIFEGLPASLPAEFLAAAARLAGVHLYVPPNTATVWSGAGHTAVQAVADRKFTLTLPGGKTRELDLKKGECRLLDD